LKLSLSNLYIFLRSGQNLRQNRAINIHLQDKFSIVQMEGPR